MIDTDKYEGHTLGPWEQYSVAAYHAVVIPMERGGCLDDGKATELVPHTLEDAKLIADAPLLLAEVKRLREEVEHLLMYRDIVEEYDGFFAPEDHTSRWQLLMEEHRGDEE
tara:strand:- start:592 stop:924 length:333 start_codon:yes stop_codon:yes gene_type:complete